MCLLLWEPLKYTKKTIKDVLKKEAHKCLKANSSKALKTSKLLIFHIVKC